MALHPPWFLLSPPQACSPAPALHLGLGEDLDATGSEELLGPQGQLLRLCVQGLWERETAILRWCQAALSHSTTEDPHLPPC